MQRPVLLSSKEQPERIVVRRRTRLHLPRLWLLLPAGLALVLGWIAYQLPITTRLAIGSLGDQLILRSSQAQDATPSTLGWWYPDEQDRGARYRWTRDAASMTLADWGAGSGQLQLSVAGWPTPSYDWVQPTVTVLLDDQVLGSFKPERDYQTYRFAFAAASSPERQVWLRTSAVLTSTATVFDPRPKGVRVNALQLTSNGGWGLAAGWATILPLVGLTLIGTLGVARNRFALRRSVLLLLGSGLAVVLSTALLMARVWMVAALPWLLGLALLGYGLLSRRVFARWLRQWYRRWLRSNALGYGLVGALVLSMSLVITLALRQIELPSQVDVRENIEKLVALIPLGMGLLLLTLSGPTVIARNIILLRRQMIIGRLALVLVVLFCLIWLGWEVAILQQLPFVGHADYADNAVVARNLLRGRGWVVDYVSQFYTLVPGGDTTRVQETWPLLQPVLMLPSMALLGPNAFAARLPNIVLLAMLAGLIFQFGSRLWDRRVGLLAVIITLTNLLFFRLAIYATSDLALVVWSMLAFWWVDRATALRMQSAARWPRVKPWVWAGVWTGLMILQKPSTAIFAIGMGIWVLGYWLRQARTPWTRWRIWLRPHVGALMAWVGVTVLVVSPLVIRNLIEFQRLFFSTEAWDAWVLYFRGRQAWEDIYTIYAPELGGTGLPDRSWILRWGFDQTLGKLADQVREVWRFWTPRQDALLGSTGMWLAGLGLLTLRRSQRRVITLVGAALVPYTIFLCIYWHTVGEARYFVPFVPWLALLAAGAICWLFDRLTAVDRRWTGLGGLATCLLLVSIVQPQIFLIERLFNPESRGYWGRDWEADLKAYAWIQEHTPPDAVIMTRVPWQLNFHADRPAVMIPNSSHADIERVAAYYGADFLLINGSTTSAAERAGGPLHPLVSGEPPAPWQLVHEVPDNYNGAAVRIYRFPQQTD